MGKKGFTLIELSIVLVIIGLIVGGVLVGKDLIDAAKSRSAIGQYEQFRTALNVFKLKYNALPGDLTQEQAIGLDFQPTTRTSSGNVVHGNGRLEEVNLTANAAAHFLGYEFTLFWRDLSSANLIDGTFNTATDGYTFTTFDQLDKLIPRAKIADSSFWFAYSVNGPYMQAKAGTYMNMYGARSLTSYAVNRFNSITPAQAFSIDSKLDNGLPNTGFIMGADQTNSNIGANFISTSSCASSNQATATYAATADVPGCQISFFLF